MVQVQMSMEAQSVSYGFITGKSNLMDAISFVLGVQARHMRGANLADLIYKPSGAEVVPENEDDSDDSVDQE